MTVPAQLGLAEHLAYALELAVGFVFLMAAVSKLREPSAFVRTVDEYQLFSALITRIAAFALIGIESFLALSFLSGWLRSVGLPLGIVTLAAFSLVVAVNLRRGRRVPCGCFGARSEQISRRALSRVLLLFGSCLLLAGLTTASGLPGTYELLANAGTDALVYVVEIACVSAFFIILALWLLHLPEVMPVLRNLGRLHNEADVPSNERHLEAT